MRLLGIVVLTGCGRLAFDPVAADDASADGAPIGHDEDGDGVADPNDVCPFLADPAQDDQDGDRVGDACDREPQNARQTLALFRPMRADDPSPSRVIGAWTQQADARQSAGADYQALEYAIAYGDVDIYCGIDVIEHPAYPQQIGITLGNVNGQPYYYGEVFRSIGALNGFSGVSYFDGTTYSAVNQMNLATPFPIGATMIHLRAALAGPTLTFDSDLDVPYTASGSAPSYAPQTLFALTVQHSIIAVRYIAVITTTP